jgi:hypothetical protein
MTSEHDPELDAKVASELDAGKSYDAIQFCQSYLARKSTSVSSDVIASRCLHATRIFILKGFGVEAGILFQWFLTQPFQESLSTDTSNAFIEEVSDILSSSNIGQSAAFAENIHQGIISFVTTKSSLGDLPSKNNLYESMAKVFQTSENWETSLKFYLLTGDIASVAACLNNWANRGVTAEYPLFFCRNILQLLQQKKAAIAMILVSHSEAFINAFKRSSASVSAGPALLVWNFTVIFVDLINLGSKVSSKEKKAIYELLSQKFQSSISSADPDLLNIIKKVATENKLLNTNVSSSVPPLSRFFSR